LFSGDALKTHLETSATVSLQSLVLAEWNMNMPDNIQKIGNYRYRPSQDTIYKNLPINYDPNDQGNFYTGATDADVVVDGGVNDLNVPQLFTSSKDKMKMLYSLEDCIKPFRPRSGINKPLFIKGKYLANSGANIAQRPRYYMPSKYDQFRYWTSYRTENNMEYGIAKILQNGKYFIEDTVPFIVYKDQVPANRIVIKMQTNVGDIDLGPFIKNNVTFPDPLFGTSNKTTPQRWKIQYLYNNTWTDAFVVTESTLRPNGDPVIGNDGYVELQYGLNIPTNYSSSFKLIETLSSNTLLPESSVHGYAYLVVTSATDLGKLYIWNSGLEDYEMINPTYGWSLADSSININTPFVTDLTTPSSFYNNSESRTWYREFQYIRGIRIVVDTMNKFDSTFDLIEMSPRLIVNISDNVLDFQVTKSLSDIGNTSLPVGQLLASTGSISIFDIDQSFNENNSNSIIYKYIRKNIKFSFYESILDVGGYDYYVPIKTLYSEGIPSADMTAGVISIDLRDFYFYLESMPAPTMLVTQVSLSYAISLLLDYIGFTNYSFKKLSKEKDTIIPYFFISPDQNVAEVLNKLAVSTQTAMFFDEYNNFIVMSKDFLMPELSDRPTDFILLGNNNQSDTGVTENSNSGNIPNIIDIASQDKQIFNDGKITYTTRYIQRSYGSIKQASLIDKEKNWIYKPVLLWEVAGTESLKTINEQSSNQSTYVLGAMPLNSNLTNSLPSVSSNKLINNIIDIGENVYWLTRYQGYLYSNGEIIRYDAAQFNITLPIWYPVKSDGTLDETKPQIVLPGKNAPSNLTTDAEILAWRQNHRQGSSNVWISSNEEYQNYFSSLPFNGKIYPTGLLRIYAEPYYETVDGITRMKNGEVYQHGRGQFGTSIATHSAGISSHWTNNDNVRGCQMSAGYIFTISENPVSEPGFPSTEIGNAGNGSTGIESTALAKQSSRSGIIKNFMSTDYLTETQVSSLTTTQSGTVQSSALIMSGPSFKSTDTPLNFISYVYKNLESPYKHFGTRMRIVGKIENNENRNQTPIGSTPYYQIGGVLPSQNITIAGGSGGIAVMLNPATNNGYYFEIVALTEANVESYLGVAQDGKPNVPIHNIVFYKVKKEVGSNNAIPVKLWGGLSKIIVDDGRFTGQYRIAGEENPTVYDLAVEYEDIGKIRRFYLYINNKLVQIVDDKDPLPVYQNIALFTRGSSKCMFENIYAISQNYSQNTVATVGETVAKAFGDVTIDINEAFRKYAMSGIVQATYLSGISSQQPPKYNMYFEEFGSIMRECAYFDIRYDRAYPALYAQLSPTFNKIKGYTTSGFYANSYGAEFMIFNATDSALSLDETSGNYLRIQGIGFTQDTTHELSVDEYFKKRSNLLDTTLNNAAINYSPLVEKQKYNEINLSRMTYGKNEFSIDAPYIQTQDAAESLMGWIINKLIKPKKSVGINIFAIPTLQLGDIVTINYKNSDNLQLVADPSTRFVIYNIQYERNSNGPNMTIYLSEV
jgi:hypothetical protein